MARQPIHPFEFAEQARLQRDIVDPAKVEVRAGVRYWRSNGAVIPPFVYEDAAMICPAVQSAAYKEHLDRTLVDYRKNRAPMSWDNRAEMENALGSDAVDIFTGEKA